MSDVEFSEPSSTSAQVALVNAHSEVSLGGSSNSTSQSVVVTPTDDDTDDAADGRIEDAVYTYIQAVRALGRTTINTSEIASALGIDRRKVEAAAAALKDKGVKAAQ